MTEEPQRYYKDIRGRRNVPKGQLSVIRRSDAKKILFVLMQTLYREALLMRWWNSKKENTSVVFMENFVNRKVLLKYGVRSGEDEKNPNYPILAWDGKGTRLAVIYSEEGKIKLFVYESSTV